MSSVIKRAATVGLVRTNHLPELSLAGECQSQREHQKGSKGQKFPLIQKSDKLPQTLLILLNIEFLELVVGPHSFHVHHLENIGGLHFVVTERFILFEIILFFITNCLSLPSLTVLDRDVESEYLTRVLVPQFPPLSVILL